MPSPKVELENIDSKIYFIRGEKVMLDLEIKGAFKSAKLRSGMRSIERGAHCFARILLATGHWPDTRVRAQPYRVCVE
jgi:hypothetical protein